MSECEIEPCVKQEYEEPIVPTPIPTSEGGGGLSIQALDVPPADDFVPNQNTIYSAYNNGNFVGLFVYDGRDFVPFGGEGSSEPCPECPECAPELSLCGVRVYNNTTSNTLEVYNKLKKTAEDYMYVEWGSRSTINAGRTQYIQVLGDPEDHIYDLLVINVRGADTDYTFTATQGVNLTKLFAVSQGESSTDVYFRISAYVDEVDLSNITITVSLA